jgi:hypothetical protein
MDSTIGMMISDILRNLPEKGARRAATLQHLIDLVAAEQAASSLRAAATDVPEPLRSVMTAAVPLCEGDFFGAGDLGPVDLARWEPLARAIVAEEFIRLVGQWVQDLRDIANDLPETGACTVGTAMHLWNWTVAHVQRTVEPPRREVATLELAAAFLPLLAAHSQIVDVARLPVDTNEDEDRALFFADLARVQSARASARAGTLCADIVFGYRAHPKWDEKGCAACYQEEALDALEGIFPGFASAPGLIDVIRADGSHPKKAGPCARTDGVEAFTRIRAKLDTCMTGARLARERVAEALPRVWPEISR